MTATDADRERLHVGAYDPAMHRVGEVTAHLDELRALGLDDEYLRVLTVEQQGQQRRTILAKLDELDADTAPVDDDQLADELHDLDVPAVPPQAHPADADAEHDDDAASIGAHPALAGATPPAPEPTVAPTGDQPADAAGRVAGDHDGALTPGSPTGGQGDDADDQADDEAAAGEQPDSEGDPAPVELLPGDRREARDEDRPAPVEGARRDSDQRDEDRPAPVQG